MLRSRVAMAAARRAMPVVRAAPKIRASRKFSSASRPARCHSPSSARASTVSARQGTMAGLTMPASAAISPAASK